MKIVITGSKGFIGSHLVDALGEHQIIEWDTKIEKNINNFNLKSTTDIVIHLAGLIDVRESILKPDDYWLNNVVYSKKIFNMCNDMKIPLLYASSAAVKEWYRSPYGATKKVLEEISHDNQIGLRFETVFGEGSSAFGLYTKIKNKTLTYKTNHIRDFIHVDDIVDCIKMFIRKKDNFYEFNKVYEIGTGIGYNVSDVVDYYKLDVPLKEGDVIEIPRSVANTKLINELGWKAKRNIYNK